ncbi:hypothetical protein SMA90_33520, partial [Escherichia coli]
SGYLIWAHCKEEFFRGEYTIFCEDVQDGVPGEKCTCKSYEVGNGLVARICPVTGKFKAVTRLPALFSFPAQLLLYVRVSGGIAVIL